MKYLINLIALAVLAGIVYGIIQFKDSDTFYAWKKSSERSMDKAARFIGGRTNTARAEMFPERKRPLTFIEREEQLRQYLPMVFKDFTQEDWNSFWSFIFDPVEKKGKGLFAEKHQRSREEIAAVLVDKYPNPFSRFREDHWFYFWQIVLGPDIVEPQ